MHVRLVGVVGFRMTVGVSDQDRCVDGYAPVVVMQERLLEERKT